MKNYRVALAAALLAGTTMAGQVNMNAGAAAPSASPGCGFEARALPQGVGKDGVPLAQEWLEDVTTQADLGELAEGMNGDPSVIQVVPGVAERAIVVVVDVGKAPAAKSKTAIEKARGKLGAKAEVRLVQACVAKADLDQTSDDVQHVASLRSDLLTDSTGGTAVSTNYATGRVEIRGSGPIATAIASHSKNSKWTKVIADDIRLSSRMADSNPHYGGARYGVYNGSALQGWCTSGFSAYDGYGNPGMATAAHCGPVGWTAWSSGSPIGTMYPHSSGYTWHSGSPNAYDVSFLYSPPSVATYSNGLYTDPGAPSARFATTWGDAAAPQSVCLNGSYSLAQCGATFQSYSAQICGQNADLSVACYWAVQVGRSTGGLTQEGDSGGTVYQQTGTNTAKINGTITGGNVSGTVAFITPTSFFKNQHNVTPKVS